jgi:formiminotetrahydrofolate cyclodeaminase
VSSLRDLTVAEFLDAVASDDPAPGGGAVAALVTAQAAGLAAMAGRFSIGRSTGADAATIDEIVAEAERLRAAAAPLADADADAYEAFLAAVRLPREPDPQERAQAVSAALSAAADVPLTTAEAAARVVELAARLVVDGNPNLRGDAVAAAMFAAAAASTAAVMVTENLARTPDDARIARAVQAAAAARRSADEALGRFGVVAVEVLP